LSVQGMMPLCDGFDHVGPMARSVADIATCYLGMLGCLDLAPGFLTDPGAVEVLRITDPYGARMQPATISALDRAAVALAACGHRVRTVALPSYFQELERVFKDIVFDAMARYHGADAHPAAISENFAAIIAHGRNLTPAALAAAEMDADRMRGHLLRVLRGQTIILAPATDGVAPFFGESTGSQMLQSLWSLSGAPALAVPAGFEDGLPVGVTLIAAPNQERLLLSLADRLRI